MHSRLAIGLINALLTPLNSTYIASKMATCPMMFLLGKLGT